MYQKNGDGGVEPERKKRKLRPISFSSDEDMHYDVDMED